MYSGKFICLLIAGLLALQAHAQNYVFSNDIPVFVNGQPLTAAWAGGLNTPQFNPIDLDNDGILDLVVFDRVGQKLLTFRNGGTPNQVDYSFAPEFFGNFPNGIVDWMLLRDFDADGLLDIFTAVPQVSRVRVFRNTSAATGGNLSFALYEDSIYSHYPSRLLLYMGKSDFPAIEDVDEDGDLDILTFSLGGQEVEWHKNLSIENTGGLMGMEFTVQSHCFGHFQEDANDCSAYLQQAFCGPGQREGTNPLLIPDDVNAHTGSTTLALDLDSNGLKDLLIGDVSCVQIYALHNTGTLQIADFTVVEDSFPTTNTPVIILNFPATFYLDVDNDGKKDLVAAPNSASIIEDYRGVQLHKNVGLNNAPDFSFQKYGFVQDQMIEIGSGAMPSFLDYDDDGLLDLLVGGTGRYDSVVDYLPYLVLYKNTGTAQQPAFTLVSDDYLGLRNNANFANASWIRPAPGDLDGDGDDDLLLGNTDGKLYYFRNLAASGSAANYTLVSSNFSAIDVGINSAPQLVDLDGDADLDLLVGNHQGYIRYFRNDGTVSSANFVSVTDTFGHVKVNDFTGQTFTNGYAQPFAADFDADGDLDLLVGSIDGPVQVYPNIDLSPGATFTRSNDLFYKDFGSFSSLTAGVLDSARLSFVVGDYRGGVMLLRYAGAVPREDAQVHIPPVVKWYPNPAGAWVRFTIEGEGALAVSHVCVTDALGKIWHVGEVTSREGELNLDRVPTGLYFITFSGKGGSVTHKLILQR
jgi:hypothetical protein